MGKSASPNASSSKTSLFSTLRSKLPQRKSQPSTPNSASGKKTFFNISPTNTFSSFINKNKNNHSASSDASDDGSGQTLDSNSSSSVNKALNVPKTIPPIKPKSPLGIINDGGGDVEQKQEDNEDE